MDSAEKSNTGKRWSLHTPVVFLIFNRPDTTERVFEAIRAARPPKLLIVADGPRPDRPEDVEKCQSARSVMRRVDWECEVSTCIADVNLGCMARVSTGLAWAFNHVEEAIILEDDCLPHPRFFRFCEKMLAYYRNDERVMMITGTNYLLDALETEESYCFSRYFAVWGWASWRRAWRCYDGDMTGWREMKRQEQLKSFYSQDYMRRHVAGMFDAAFEHRINSWAIRWFYACLFNNGLCVVPRVNLISNIGIEGAHSSKVTSNHLFPVFDMDTENLKHPDYVMPNRLYDDRFFEMKFNKSLVSKLARVSSKLRRNSGCSARGKEREMPAQAPVASPTPKRMEGGNRNGQGADESEADPLLTIITVVLNGVHNLGQTIESVVGQKYEKLEYVIIDGGSTDGTLDLIRSREQNIDYWVSEPDGGIYDAMNKGIACSRGKYILFLNAMDELVVDLSRIDWALQGDHILIYGKANMMEEDRTFVYVKGKPLKSCRKLIAGTPLCHQAILYRRNAIGTYNLNYRIMADRVLTYDLIAKYGISRTLFLDQTIANYFEGGFSRKNYQQWKREEIRFLEDNGEVMHAFCKKMDYAYKKYVRQQFP
jgi:GT2 family glycosyltransferase